MASPLNRYNLGLFNSGTYYPFTCDISSVSQGLTTTVTTTIDNAFKVGNQVSFRIPPQYGMTQLNGLKGYIISVPSANQIVVNIVSTNFDAFSVPTVTPPTVIDPAQVVAIGDSNTGSQSPGSVYPIPNTIPGAYYNTFP